LRLRGGALHLDSGDRLVLEEKPDDLDPH
jgi:hypothetical protein